MSDFTDWGEQRICELLTGQGSTLPSAFSVGLLKEVDDARHVEVQWPSYARVTALRDLSTWSGTQGAGTLTESSGTSRSTTNNSDFDFGIADGADEAIAVGIFWESNLLCYAMRDNLLVINDGDSVVIPAGDVTFEFPGTGGFTNFGVNKIIDLIFRGQSYEFPTEYKVALYIRVPDLMGAGGVEASGNGYSRTPVNQWSQPDGGVISNSDTVQFNPPISTWGTITGAGLLDNSGNIFFVCSYATPKTIVAGAGAPKLPAGTIAIRAQ